jgi:hypothetical protein
MPPDRQPMPDVMVVIPGILGSVLELDGREVWGLTAAGPSRGPDLPDNV